jgi:hypothetical protein
MYDMFIDGVDVTPEELEEADLGYAKIVTNSTEFSCDRILTIRQDRQVVIPDAQWDDACEQGEKDFGHV